MRIKKLSSSIIRDLTTPRYIWKIENSVKYIVDTHCNPPMKTEYVGRKLHETVDELNSNYHNHIAKHLGFDLESGVELARINRGSW